MPPVPEGARQQQFLNVISRDEATERFRQHLKLAPTGRECVPLAQALDRVLAEDVAAPVDVPAFDRSNVDGFAVRASDTYGAMEEQARRVRLNQEVLSPGVAPQEIVEAGTATTIATGGMLPRGADAVVMVEDTDVVETTNGPMLEITRALTAGTNLTHAGTDIALGETILRHGQHLSSRELGVLAAVGLAEVSVYRRPRVAIISTGNEIVPPGQPLPPGAVYDSNLVILSAAVTELGGEPIALGVVNDDAAELARVLDEALQYEAVILSGGTSKGAGDLSYQVVSDKVHDPGIVAHGVALKPGKPICLAVTDGKPIVILPGFPTSAIFTFHEFVAPVIRQLAGHPEAKRETRRARVPLRINSNRGRTEYSLVSLVESEQGLVAYPMGKGSGSVTTFSCADGFLTIGQQTEILEANSEVDVHLLGRSLEPADLVVIGSHCIGLDLLLGEMHQRGFSTKSLFVGSMGGLTAAKRGECDLAGVHLFDPKTGNYNRPFLTEELLLVPGYRRQQCFVFREDDPRFQGVETVDEFLKVALTDKNCTMVNRNAGSGTRILIDQYLKDQRPPGYALQPKSHNAVAAAIRQGRADWGVAIETVAKSYSLSYLPLQAEHYDFVVPRSRQDRSAVKMFQTLLTDPQIQQRLNAMGFEVFRHEATAD